MNASHQPLLTVSQLGWQQTVSFTLYRSDCLHISGDNGSGKSTMCRQILALLPHQGTISAIQSLRYGYLPQHSHLPEYMTLSEFCHYQYSLWHGHTMPASLWQSLVSELAWHHYIDQPIRTLSAGQRRQCQLCRLAYLPGDIWILDEPDHQLDQRSRQWLLNQLQQHLNKQRAAIVVSHHPQWLSSLVTQQCHI